MHAACKRKTVGLRVIQIGSKSLLIYSVLVVVIDTAQTILSFLPLRHI